MVGTVRWLATFGCRALDTGDFDPAYGTDSMPQTADNLADEYGIARTDQDAFAAQGGGDLFQVDCVRYRENLTVLVA